MFIVPVDDVNHALTETEVYIMQWENMDGAYPIYVKANVDVCSKIKRGKRGLEQNRCKGCFCLNDDVSVWLSWWLPKLSRRFALDVRNIQRFSDSSTDAYSV